jgi:hypothetical protein
MTIQECVANTGARPARAFGFHRGRELVPGEYAIQFFEGEYLSDAETTTGKLREYVRRVTYRPVLD